MTTTVCVECNSEIPSDSEFCPECGFPAEPGKASCPECLNPVLLSLDACPECGFPLDELRQTHASAAAEAAVPGDESAPAGPVGANREAAVATAFAPDGDLTNQVLQAQIASLNDLTEMIGKLVDNNNNSAINELVASIGTFVNSAENTNNDMLSDLITNIGRFIDSSEKIKDDMLSSMKEQNLITISSMQEVVNTFSSEVKLAAAGMKDAQKSALAEMNGVVQQVKTAAVKKSEGGSDNSYVLYICGILLFFTMMNFLVTAYVVKLVK
jgi:hypothetical protein